MGLGIKWLRREFHQLSADELYQLMVFRQKQLLRIESFRQVDADGLDPLAWHLMAFDPEQGMVAYARICLPFGTDPELRVDRLLCEPMPGLEAALVAQVLDTIDHCFKMTVECEVTDAQLEVLKARGFEMVVDRPASRSGMVSMRREYALER
ncbi:hypothetical protein [Aestuariirhabdus sp. LZHN29]|uniref:hypothetical protein n=1 Tax=Aestuariirhabdus sp. LZHN29 TaxID=3417462 RepID=UPI003CF76C89